MKPKYPALYKKYFVDKGDERLELFRIIRDEFGIKKGLYPGSFAHITPSLVIPRMTYVDMDKRCKKFYQEDTTLEFVQQNKEYQTQPHYTFHEMDYTHKLDEKPGSFDLLISLYAGFISKYCGRHLKKDGILLANNSHGDAPLAYLDKKFTLIGTIKRTGNKFKYSTGALDTYFVTKSGKKLNKAEILKTMRGPAYKTSPYAYVFKRK